MSIVINNLVKYYGELLIVNNFSVEISDGEFFALLGASGSGKSTVLRMIAGLSRPSSGSILLNGRDVTSFPPQKREVGFVFQNYAIFKHMTVAQNIEFGLKVRGVSRGERLQRQEELLEIVGLTGMGSRYPHQISGGQRQRVALARALAYRPSVLLLDEPFGALDAAIRSQLRESVREIQRKLRITTILVTHDQEEAFELADRIGVLDKGKLVEIGDSYSLYHRPQHSYAATFLGAGNVLVGRVRDERIKLGSVKLEFPPDAPRHVEGDPVRVLFRPENILCLRKGEKPAENAPTLGEGIIEDTVFTGAFVHIKVRVLNLIGVRPINAQYRYGEGILVTALQPSAASESTFRVGDKCDVYLRSFHVLMPGGLRMLIRCDTPGKDSPAWQFGSLLAAAAHGRVTVLDVFRENSTIEAEKKKMEETFLPDLDPNIRLDFKIKQGPAHYETLLTAQEDFFDVVILERPQLSEGRFGSIDLLTMTILEDAKVPVILTARTSRNPKKILVCTAAGAPGKTDVFSAARIARQTGAAVTVLHILQSDELLMERRQRAERHLQEAKNILSDLGVSAETVIKNEPALQTIINTAKDGDFDLIVVGAPGPQESIGLYAKSLTSKIIAQTELPVLIVPTS